MVNTKHNDPTVDELKKVNRVVLDFIKKKKLVLYGGTAINEILKLKKDSIYSAGELPDYDFFSIDSNRDSMELSNLLMKRWS